jgi:hypothetical protein
MTKFIDIPTTLFMHVTDTTTALATSLSENPINLLPTDTTKSFTLMPANNLNLSVIGQALAQTKSLKG